MKKFLIATMVGATILAGTMVPTFAGETDKDAKCNSGRGNGSEAIVVGVECDPGNSGTHNQGGD